MRKQFKRILAVLLVAVMASGSAPLAGFVGLDLPDFGTLFATKAEAATYNGTCGDDLTWTLDTSTGELIISGTGDMTDWLNYSSVPWYTDRSKITSVTIGDGVTSIGDWAFYNYYTNLESITIGKDVASIGYNVFENCSALIGITVDSDNTTYSSDEHGVLFNKGKTELLRFPIANAETSYEIPDSVTLIGEYAFSRCSSLTSITIPDSVTSIDNYAFYYCKALTSVTIPDSVTSIGNSAFYHCDQSLSFTIGNNVKSIGSYAFAYSPAFTSITIPDSVTSIGYFAFGNCTGLTSISVPDSVTMLGGGAFTSCGALENVILGNGITKIEKQTFFFCSGLKNITIGSNVTSIGENAFYYCSKLSSVEIPDSVTDIEDSAFFHCNGLTSVTIGKGVKSLGPSAFDYCQKLTSITIPDNVTSIGPSAFYHCDALTSVTIGNGVTSIGNSAFSMCTSLSDLTIGNSVTSIGNSAFSSCDGLTSVTIPNSVTTIGDDVFSSCEGLVSISIPAGVTSIGESPFYSCISLTNITVDPGNPAYSCDEYGALFNKDKTELIQYPIANTRTSYEIPEGVTNIAAFAFYNCGNLTSVTIPDSVTSIGRWAFRACKKLTSATVPDGVISIGEKAFYECSKLASITIPDSVTDIGEAAFQGCSNATNLTIGNGITGIGVSVFESCYSVESITIPDSVTSIGDEAFKNCNAITSITIPGNVTSIGYQAFYNCYNLVTATISDGVTSIGDEAFYGCDQLESITISDSVKDIGSDAFYGTFVYEDSACWEDGVLYIGNHLIKAETSLSEAYSVKEGTKAIAASAFYECTELFEVTIPDGATSIGDSAFYGCSSLYSVTTPGSITNIGDYAFYNCNNLTEFSIPESVVNIGDYAFYDCTYIDDIIIPDGVTGIGAYVFYDCDLLTNITIPDSVTSIGDFAFYNCYNIRNIIIPDGVTSIGVRAFYKCSKLSNLTIPDSVVSVNNAAFAYCSALTSITIPDSLTTINREVFSYCTGLTSVYIPEGITELGFAAFEYCTKLTSVTIPDSVTRLDGSVFSGCKQLADITIHDNVTYFGHDDFYNTAAYNDSANWENGVFYLGNYLIDSVDSMSEDCSVKEGTIMIADSAFLWNDTIKSITIPDSVKSINGSSFYDCDVLTSVTMGSGVRNISESAFEHCDALTDVYYHGTENDWNAITIAEKNEPLINATRHYIYSYSLVYDANGGAGAPDEQNEDITYTVSSTVPTRSGYNFLGWSTDSNATSAEYVAGDSITLTEDTVLYAVWSMITYTLSYDANGGVGTVDEQTGNVVYIIGSTIPTRSGYNFLGWSTNSNATSAEYVVGDSITLTEDTVLYAVWSMITYTLSYDANGGVGTVDEQTGNVVYIIGSTIPTRSGYNFLGWSTDSNATSAEYVVGDSITLTEDTVLYAVWSMITYTLSYDANGGVGTVDEQTGNVVYIIGSTIPTRSGYNFLGWSTDSNATSAEYVPGDSIILTSDTTLFAVWEKKSYSLVKSDIFSFINSRSNFKTGTYTMTDEDFTKLTNYVRNMYNATAAQIFINRLQVARSDAWGGSCFGMSMSVILNKTGQIDFVNNFDPVAADMYGVSRPYQNEAVQSAINYYQISQRVNAFRTTTYTVDKGNFSTGLEKLVDTVKEGNMTLIIYSWPEGCHAIVIVGYEEAEGGGHNLIAYDNRYGSNYINVYIDEEYTTCTVNGTEEAYYVEFNTDFSIFDKIDIDGSNNDMVFETMALSSESIGTEIGVKLNGDISIKNAAGETLTIKDGAFDGNMEVFSSYMIVNSSADGTPVPGTLMLEVKDSNSFTFESTADEITASLTTEDCYAEVTATADKVIISEDEGIYATGNDVEFSGWLSLNNDMGDVINFDGRGDNDVNLLYGNNDEVIIEGATDECTVTVYSNLVDVDTVTFNSDYETLKVSEKAGNIAITASSENNGVFDVKVAEIINTEPTLVIVNPSTTKISYGDSIVLHANTDVDLPIGYYIVWTADNANFSYTVSDDGKTCTITPSSSGDTTFTATVYDANGNIISKDDQTMTSNAGFFRKFIAFFKKLFGMTKVIPEVFKGIF